MPGLRLPSCTHHITARRALPSTGTSGKRFASHGAPFYNEPTGYLFGEKVSDAACGSPSRLTRTTLRSRRRRARSGNARAGRRYTTGACSARWASRPCCSTSSPIPGPSIALDTLALLTRPRSIQTWALQEAKARMEARGELPKYVPSATASAGRSTPTSS